MISIIIVRYKLHFKDRQTLSLWRSRIDKENARASGFLDKTELPAIGEEDFHTVVLRFNNKANAENWLNSDVRRKLFQHSAPMQFFEIEEIVQESDAFWFAKAAGAKAKKWKQWLIVFMAVYPLSIIYSAIVNSILEELDLQIGLFRGTLITLMISFTMVHMVMPNLLRSFGSWLKR